MHENSERCLIVNADDVGLCPGVHRGVLAGVRAGTVTSISVLAGPDFQADLGPYDDAGVSVGLHLNLTLGSPCAPPGDIPSLLDGDGRFVPDRTAALGRLAAEEAEREMRCQLDRFREWAGRDPTHLNTHKHMHAHHRGVFRAAAAMARELNVPLRSRDETERSACRDAGVVTTDGFLGDVRPAPYWTVERLEHQLPLAPRGTTELMCHPGADMEAVPGLWYVAHRETEAATFCSARAVELLAAFALTNFTKASLG